MITMADMHKYTDFSEIKTPANCIKINATEIFPKNILAPAKHAKNWLKSKRGIPCNPARAYIAEYNFRMFVANNENVGDSIMKDIANLYGPTFIDRKKKKNLYFCIVYSP